MNVARHAREVKHVISLRVGGKPVFAINLLAPGSEFGEEIFIILGADIGYSFAKSLNNLKVAVVDPYASLEISFALFYLFGSNVEDIRMQFIFLLLANI